VNQFQIVKRGLFTKDEAKPGCAVKEALRNKSHKRLNRAPHTGSGKTVAAFLASLDELFQTGLRGELRDGIPIAGLEAGKIPNLNGQKPAKHPVASHRPHWHIDLVMVGSEKQFPISLLGGGHGTHSQLGHRLVIRIQESRTCAGQATAVDHGKPHFIHALLEHDRL
jgi:hypothetical protein